MTNDRRTSHAQLARVCALSAMAVLQAANPAIAKGPPATNFLFVLADDLGWGDLACYGNPEVRTPNLDRLAREGILLTQFYAAAPVCSPSRVGFMTGRFPSTLDVHTIMTSAEKNERYGTATFLDPDTHTVTGLLRAVGYKTGHYGKWHLCLPRRADMPTPSEYGIDEYRASNCPTADFPQKAEPQFLAKSADYYAEEAIAFIERHRAEPFYLNVWMELPHAPLQPTEEQFRRYEALANPAIAYRSAKQIYYASVTALDAAVGKLIARLDELGLSGSTMVLFSSDNGPESIHFRIAGHSGVGSTGPFRGRKWSLYEGGIRVPMIVRWPGHVPRGRVDDESVVAGVDLLPTLAKIAGVELPSNLALDGEDRSGVFLGAASPRTKRLFWDWRYSGIGPVIDRSPISAVREGHWKLLINPDRSRIELYDVVRDPSELQNEAKDNPDVVQRLSATLGAWRASLPPADGDSDAGKNDYAWPRGTGE